MKRIITISAVLILVFSAAVLAMGSGECKGKGMEKGEETGMERGNKMAGPRMILAMASELNLTADQMDKIKKLIDAMPAKDGPKEDMMKDRDVIKEEMQKDSPDQAKLDAMIDRMAEKHKAAIKDRIKSKLETDAILTKEQKEILKKKIEEKKKEREEKKEERKDKKCK